MQRYTLTFDDSIIKAKSVYTGYETIFYTDNLGRVWGKGYKNSDFLNFIQLKNLDEVKYSAPISAEFRIQDSELLRHLKCML